MSWCLIGIYSFSQVCGWLEMVSPYYSNLDPWQLSSFSSSGKTLCGTVRRNGNVLKFLSVAYPKTWEFWMAFAIPDILFHTDFAFPGASFHFKICTKKSPQDQTLKSVPIFLDLLFESGSWEFCAFSKHQLIIIFMLYFKTIFSFLLLWVSVIL